MTYDFARNYQGVKAPGALFAVLMTLGVNAGLFAMLGWMNHRAKTVRPAPVISAHSVDLVHKLEPTPPPIEAVKLEQKRSRALKIKPVPPQPRSQIMPQVPMPVPLLLPDVEMPTGGLPLVDNLSLPVPGPQADADGRSDGTSIHDEATVGQKPVRTHFVRPLYPLTARRMGLAGWVKVAFVVNADGEVSDVTVLKSTGRGRFDKSALRAVSRWRFKPGRQGGQAVAVRCEVTIEFNLED